MGLGPSIGPGGKGGAARSAMDHSRRRGARDRPQSLWGAQGMGQGKGDVYLAQELGQSAGLGGGCPNRNGPLLPQKGLG